MKRENMIDAVGNIDGDLIENYFKIEAKLQGTKKRRVTWVKFVAVAACVAMLAAVCVMVLPLLDRNEPTTEQPTLVDGLERPYKDTNILDAEFGIVWPWDKMTVYEKFGSMGLDGVKFKGCCREIAEALIGKKLGNYSATGYDNIENKSYSEKFDVYEIKNVSSTRAVAAEMEGKYYVFTLDKYSAPATLGDLIDEYGLNETLTLSRFSKNEQKIGVYKAPEYFVLNDDAYVWEIINSCREAVSVSTAGWHETNNNYLSFTVTSESLGVYKRVLYVTEHGYVYTNLADYEYLYYIGENAANRIISYAMDNSEATGAEPYNKAIIGNVTEITDEYILIDDSVLCRDPSDGIVFKVMLNDLRITRYVENEIIKVGDTVRITYEKGIDIEDGYIIDSAIAASEAIISGDNVLIPE